MPLSFSELSADLNEHFDRNFTGTNEDFVGENIIPEEICRSGYGELCP